MKKSHVAFLSLMLLSLAAAYGFSRYRAVAETPLVILTSEEQHIATPEMIEAARSREERDAPGFHARDADGRDHDLHALAAEGPLALFFIKDGCPCSVAAQPFYSDLHRAYGERIRFLAVIDGDAETARRWGRSNHVDFPILCDPELRIVREYGAENSAYFAIIAQGGAIDRYWPGYSVGMLQEASERLARLGGVDPQPIDASEAPEELYSGCSFDL